MSTIASMERIPPRRSFSCIQSGLWACRFSPDDAAEITGAICRRFNPDREGSIDSGNSWRPSRLDHVHAVEHADFTGQTRDAEAVGTVRGQIHIDADVVEHEVFTDIGPDGASSGSSMMPSASTSIPSSLKEQSMPWDGWPRATAFLMVKSPGRVAPDGPWPRTL